MTKPPFRHYLGEARIGSDWLRGRMTERQLASRWPGDGRDVMVMPGLFTADNRMAMLRRVLDRAGYRSHGWGLGRNMPVAADLFERLDARFDELDNQGPVTLVGWSLGGVVARQYAKYAPQRVAGVITLGSPFSGDPRANRAWRLYELVADHKVDAPPIPGILSEKPPVPTVAIWSPRDGIIPPDAARGEAHERDAEMQINCGHFAMSCAPDALEAVLMALSQRLGQAHP
jgi:pimeloyl-ACP methyl ester carboxylesterase